MKASIVSSKHDRKDIPDYLEKHQQDELIITSRPDLQLERRTFRDSKIIPDEHRTIVVDERYQDLSKLIVHMEGSSWKVLYYAQVLDRDTSLAGHNPFKDAIHQQYVKIADMIFKVDSPLQWHQNEETKEGYASGSAKIHPPFIPNAGDMFIADAGDGNLVLFEITSSEKLSMFKQSVYGISYQSVTYVDNVNDDTVIDLEDKVIDTKYFVMDYLEHGQNPVILESEKKLLLYIDDYYPKIFSYYLRKYFSTRFKKMILPRTDITVYDHFLTKAIQKWFSVYDYPTLKDIKPYPVENILALKKSLSVFDMVSEQSTFNRADVFTRVGICQPHLFYANKEVGQVAYTGMSYIIYPIDNAYSVDTEDYIQSKRRPEPRSLPGYNYPRKSLFYRDITLIPDIDLNDSYIFSANFYLEETHLTSHIELLLYRYLHNQFLDNDTLDELINSWSRWNEIQQFYLTPFLLVLMNAKKRGM